jgi:hypothetical protein
MVSVEAEDRQLADYPTDRPIARSRPLAPSSFPPLETRCLHPHGFLSYTSWTLSCVVFHLCPEERSRSQTQWHWSYLTNQIGFRLIQET